jgi:lipopolysaccharide biosynthesis glycosyltransferase
MKSLLYFPVFYNEGYVKLSELLLESIDKFGNVSNNFDILILTSQEFKTKLEKNNIVKKFNIKFFLFEVDNLYDACITYLRIFEYENINNYKKILMIDADILITGDLNKIFNLSIDNKLYAVGEPGSRKWHYFLWVKSKVRWLPKIAFSCGVFLFNNCNEIKGLFCKVHQHIKTHIREGKKMPSSMDQPFVIYHCINHNNYNNTLLNDYIQMAQNINEEEFINKYDKYNKKVILHHVGTGTGGPDIKIKLLSAYLKKINNN